MKNTVIIMLLVIFTLFAVLFYNFFYHTQSHFSNKIYELGDNYYYLDESDNYKKFNNFRVTEAIYYHANDIFVSDDNYLVTIEKPRYKNNGDIIEYYFNDLNIDFATFKEALDNYNGDNSIRTYSDKNHKYLLDDNLSGDYGIVKLLE